MKDSYKYDKCLFTEAFSENIMHSIYWNYGHIEL